MAFGGNKQSFNCPSCLASVFIACRNISHERMTCQVRNLVHDVVEQGCRDEEWTSTAGAKKCSRCQVFIQKIDGCNRIQCHYGAHICWICLAAFNDSGTTYSHLSGSWGSF
ncbi:hypothetical protein M378DRAFT_625078 [Amanita muscaria Koide BX008]|uniref:RING-type domain-containing protein n=1 Tax=Amanita muscaria (strain Koide BX008) TaxID=946122 RepID=A0A0C2XMV6_AMAMK|nr:hypothetical protein M378DRAFT_625078 [Amanita muscaria Koide BX008]